MCGKHIDAINVIQRMIESDSRHPDVADRRVLKHSRSKWMLRAAAHMTQLDRYVEAAAFTGRAYRAALKFNGAFELAASSFAMVQAGECREGITVVGVVRRDQIGKEETEG